ncbi:DUF4097 family beta strand repeat-containing protein [Rhizosaccharibacter radicis]|uniref:DUF4097 domain-containing protein n=1 Tax=Rhizosaccharibacter radicis TaxID=2782605 RepID=A0ABT1VSK9_9PROT|nr:DUF4097 domain-containing protein [Acetobacteraceae bacterium KSS12]
MPLFPITDTGRAGDIRMRRRRAGLLLGGIVLGGWMLAGPSHRNDRAGRETDESLQRALATIDRLPVLLDHIDHATHSSRRRGLPQPGANDPSRTLVASGGLDIDIGCASSITLLAVPGMAEDQAILSARPDQADALQAVALNEQTGRIGSGGNSCDHQAHQEDADFILRVAPERPLTIAQWGSTDIRAGAFSGPVRLSGNGYGSVSIERTGPLVVQQRSSGDMSVGSVQGPLDADMESSGGLSVGSLEGTLDADIRSSGDLSINGGEIRDLRLRLHSSGDVRMNHARTTGQASILTESSGDVVGSMFSGSGFSATTRGSGDVVFASVQAEAAMLESTGAGDISIRGGTIEQLTATGSGSGDISVQAAVRAGRIIHDGPGDISIPRLQKRADGG